MHVLGPGVGSGAETEVGANPLGFPVFGWDASSTARSAIRAIKNLMFVVTQHTRMETRPVIDPLQPTTAALLRAIAELVNHVQARPTDHAGLVKCRAKRAKAEADWIAAGTPDLSAEVARPTAMPADVGTRRNDDDVEGEDDGEKDWTPTDVEVEVRRVTEKAYLFNAGDGRGDFWCPKSVVHNHETYLFCWVT